jgi:hypothetical protein
VRWSLIVVCPSSRLLDFARSPAAPLLPVGLCFSQVRKSALGPHCLFIFVAPPSHDELERRLRNRGTETEDKVLQRLANAESEIAKAQVSIHSKGWIPISNRCSRCSDGAVTAGQSTDER